MAQRRRPTYAPEFKAAAVRLVRTSADALPKIARDLNVPGPHAAAMGGGRPPEA